MTDKLTVMVTGGAGYIGSHTCLALLDAGYQVIVIDDLSTGNLKVVPKDCQLIEGNVSDDALISKIIVNHSISAVIHFAGSIIVEESVANPLKYYQNNTSATCRLIQTCTNNDVHKFIFSSTAAVYGNADLCPVSEETPTVPINPYGASKAMIERILADVAFSSDFNFIALRYFNVAGADPQQRSGQLIKNATHLIKVACETALGKREKITIFGNDYNTPDGTCIRDYIHVSDLATAHVLALKYLEEHTESHILNCGYGKGYSVSQVLDTMEDVSGNPLNIELGPRRPGDAAEIVADNQKILSILGWKPQYQELKKIISDALSWEKINT